MERSQPGYVQKGRREGGGGGGGCREVKGNSDSLTVQRLQLHVYTAC